jgi:RNase H-like domain found in reverse transcriptase
VVVHLTDATPGGKKDFDWGSLQDVALARIKEAFTTAPVLRLPDPTRTFMVTTDANDYGKGGVLEQEWPDGTHPVAYVSRKLSDPERNYPTHDRELLAIIHVIKELRFYLHGSTFTIQTDHHPLRNLDTKPYLSKRQVRWLDALSEYDYVIKYIRGKWNILSDALSRRPDGKPQLFMGEEEGGDPLQLSAMTAFTITLHEQVLEDLMKDYLAEPELRDEYLLPDDLKKQDGLLYNLVILVIPDGKLRMVLMHDYQDTP